LLDREFHLIIARAAKNTILSDLLRNLTERSLRTWFSSLTPENQYHRVHDEHDAILAAIEQHSPDAAEATMRRHFESFRSSITRHL
jgi:DNA-binding GntR family transcriptional regulator